MLSCGQQSNSKKTSNFMACKTTSDTYCFYTATRIPCDRKCIEMMSDHRCIGVSIIFPA